MTPTQICLEALAEDIRNLEPDHFDVDGFSNFNPEEDTDDVEKAWGLYWRIVYGDEPMPEVLNMNAQEILAWHVSAKP